MLPERDSGVSRRSLLLFAAATGAVGLWPTARGTRQSTQSEPPDVPSTLPSASRLDRESRLVTLPVYRGTDALGADLWYAVTATSRIDESLRQEVNWAPKLANAIDTEAVQRVGRAVPSPRTRRQAPVPFPATVDFDPPNRGFGSPLAVAEPGYSPLVTPDGDVPTATRGVVYNAPHLVNRTGRHPAVVAFDRDELEVRVRLSSGFVDGGDALYLGAEASTEPYAVLEGATYTPALAAVPAAGDRSLEAAAREPLFAVLNGPTGARDLERQGTNSARAGEGDPGYVFHSSQVCRDATDPTDCSVFYSPTWGVYEVAWRETAIEAGARRLLTDGDAVLDAYLADEVASATPDGPADRLLAALPASGPVVDAPLVDVVTSTASR